MNNEDNLAEQIDSLPNTIQSLHKFAAELIIANKELAFYNEEKEKRAAELINMHDIFAVAPVGMLLLDETAMIVNSNAVIARLVSRTSDQIIEYRCGGGLGCIHSVKVEQGCGFASACQECPLRKGIQQVLKSGDSVRGVEMQYTVLIEEQEHRLWLSVNAEPVLLKGRKHVVVAIDDITERKRTEKALQSNTALLEAQVNASPDGILMVDENQKVILANRRIIELFNVPKNILNVSRRILCDTDDAALFEHVLSLTKVPGQFFERVKHLYDHRDEIGRDEIEFKNGMILDRYSAPVWGEDGKYYGRIWNFCDITDCKRNEEAVLLSEARFRSYFELPLTGRAITSPNKGWMEVNSTLCNLLGYSKSELMQMTWTELTHPDDLAGDVTQFNRLLSGEIDGYMLDKRFICKDGHSIFTHLAVQCLRHPDRSVDCLVAIIIDISELKQAEERLKSSEQRFRSLFKLAPIPLALNDMNGNVIYLNDRFTEFFGYTSADIPATADWFKLAYPDASYRKQVTEIWGKMTANASCDGSDIEPAEFNVTCKDGTVVIAEISGITIGDNLLVRLIDMTARRCEEAELIKAKEKAEESDRLKTAFLNNLSHEIRTPFNSILGFLSMLQDDNLRPGDRDEYFSMINKSAERLMDTINDTVEIAKIQTGLIKLTETEIDINNLCCGLLERLNPHAKIKGLDTVLKNSLPDASRIIKTDGDKLNIILTCLINNAIKFTQAGSVELGIRGNNTSLEFSIKDTGIGIPENMRQIIFDCFMQADVSNTRKFEGLGLGLSIAKAYVEMLNGRIWLESQDGEGSTFYFTIPCRLTKPDNAHSNKETPERTRTVQKNSKILVAEDDELNFAYINTILTKAKADYVILHAWTGAEALELCRNNSDIDIVLMDIKMPVMDGFIATREIRKFNPSVPIIAITAHALEGYCKKCFDAGMNDYVSKPMKALALLEVLDKWLQK